MPKPELGTKRECPSCGAKFYDLNKRPVACPKCSHELELDVAPKVKRPREAAKAQPSKTKVKETVVEDDDRHVSLDAMRDEEAAADDEDIDADLLVLDDDDVEDDDEADDVFLADDEEDEDDVSGLVRGVGSDDDV